MKVLATLVLAVTAMSLSSCACKDGKCMFSKKKTAAADCCSAGTMKTKGGSCCSN